jgi:hypothetical protein
MAEWWDKWFRLLHRTEAVPQSENTVYDNFVADFAERFQKEHRGLFESDQAEYWRQFNRIKEQEWLKVKYGK